MARLASKAKLGFYPTPPEVVELIKKFLVRKDKGKVRIFDPCSGMGVAVHELATHLQAESFGIELDKERSEQTKKIVDHVIQGDSLRVTIKPGSVSCLFLNPPYDNYEGGRLENKFLAAHVPSLQTKGIMVLVISVGSYNAWMGKFLGAWFRDVSVRAFPSSLYSRFKQVVIFAKKNSVAFPDEKNTSGISSSISSLRRYGVSYSYELDGTPEPYLVPVNDVQEKLFYFRNLEQTVEDTVKEVADDGFEKSVISKLMKRDGHVQMRPAAPLRKGHLAILVASGMTDGLIEKDGKRYLIKGTVRKEQIKTTEVEDDVTIEKVTDVLKIEIQGLDLKTGQLFSIQ